MSTFGIYSRFISQVVFSLLVAIVGIIMMFKSDWSNLGPTFYIGLNMVMSVSFWWLPPPDKPKTGEDIANKYTSIFNALNEANQPEAEAVANDV